jgi:putative membrane protein insertion efficiency factor
MTRAHRVVWQTGAPARALLLAGIRLYQLTLSSSLGGQCRFYPSCSDYGADAIRTHGAIRGSGLALWRILRCGPFTRGGVDHVRPARGAHAKYDGVLHEPVDA